MRQFIRSRQLLPTKLSHGVAPRIWQLWQYTRSPLVASLLLCGVAPVQHAEPSSIIRPTPVPTHSLVQFVSSWTASEICLAWRAMLTGSKTKIIGRRGLNNDPQRESEMLETKYREVQKSTASGVHLQGSRRLATTRRTYGPRSCQLFPGSQKIPGSVVLRAERNRVSPRKWITQALRKQDLTNQGKENDTECENRRDSR